MPTTSQPSSWEWGWTYLKIRNLCTMRRKSSLQFLKKIIFLIFTHFCHEVLPIFAAAGVKIMSFRASIFIIVVLLKYLLVRVIDGLDSFLRRIGIFQRLPDVSWRTDHPPLGREARRGLYGIGNTRGSIAGLVNDCSDDDNDFNLFIDFFNSATAVIKAETSLAASESKPNKLSWPE